MEAQSVISIAAIFFSFANGLLLFFLTRNSKKKDEEKEKQDKEMQELKKEVHELRNELQRTNETMLEIMQRLKDELVSKAVCDRQHEHVREDTQRIFDKLDQIKDLLIDRAK